MAKFLIIYRVLAPSQVVIAGFLNPIDPYHLFQFLSRLVLQTSGFKTASFSGGSKRRFTAGNSSPPTCRNSKGIWMEVSENSGFFFPPNHSIFNRVFHYFHHPFWGVPTLFLDFHPYMDSFPSVVSVLEFLFGSSTSHDWFLTQRYQLTCR